MRVGFFGLGIMGQAMSANVARKGYDVTVYNRTPRQVAELERLNVAVAATPAECAAGADALITMLTGPEACDAMLFGPHGVGEEGLRGKTLINMSTVSVAYTTALAARLAALDCAFIDAPVSGSKKPAQDGSLVILAGGEEAVVERWEPLLLTMGWKVVHCGPAGAGTMMKLAVNQLLAVMMEGLGEMLALGEKGGLSVESMLEVVLAGPLSCGLFQLKRDMLVQGEYPAQFPLKHMLKDLTFAVQQADAVNAAAPTLRAAREVFARAAEAGHGDDDFAAVRTAL